MATQLATAPGGKDAAKTVAAGPKADKPKLQPLKRGDAALYEMTCNRWTATAPAGTTPQELDQHETFFNALFDDIREGDEIKVTAADRSWRAHFEVIAVNTGRVVAKLDRVIEGRALLVGAPKAFPEGYHIERTAPNDKLGDGYVVIRNSDGQVILQSGGMPWRTYQEAHEEFLKSAIFQQPGATRYLP